MHVTKKVAICRAKSLEPSEKVCHSRAMEVAGDIEDVLAVVYRNRFFSNLMAHLQQTRVVLQSGSAVLVLEWVYAVVVGIVVDEHQLIHADSELWWQLPERRVLHLDHDCVYMKPLATAPGAVSAVIAR